MLKEKAQKYFREFMSSAPGDVTAFASRKKQLILPQIPVNYVMELTEEVTEMMRLEPSLLELKSPISVVGDLHGHLLDLFRIIKSLGSPEARQYLFLGDIVDRGEFSIETIILVFMMKIIWPKNVHIIRGNHEFGYLCSQCGFYSQITDFYGDIKLFRSFLKTFSYLPIGALIDDVTLCIHGGLSPSLFSITQIREIKRPFDNFGEESVIDGILWSDPSEEVANFIDSPRGTGYLFGSEATEEFIKSNKLKYIVRGHECVEPGYKILFDSVVTVFSASHYCGIVENDAAVLNFKKDQTFSTKVFPKMDYLMRSFVTFTNNKKPKEVLQHRDNEDDDSKLIKRLPNSARIVEPRIKKPVVEPLTKAKGSTPRKRFPTRYRSMPNSYSSGSRKGVY